MMKSFKSYMALQDYHPVTVHKSRPDPESPVSHSGAYASPHSAMRHSAAALSSALGSEGTPTSPTFFQMQKLSFSKRKPSRDFDKTQHLEMKVQYYRAKCHKLKHQMRQAKVEIREKTEAVRSYEGIVRDMEALKSQMAVNEELRLQQK
jgi:uncharacterized protein with WD repeat